MSDRTLLSASQINLFRECARKWGLRYLAKLPQPETASQALGKDVDDNQLQPYLREGRPLDFTRDSGYIAAAGLAWLPQPGTKGLEVQKHFVMPSPSMPGEFAYQGYLDLWLPYGGLPLVEDDTIPAVGDFKTTKDVKKWAKTEEQLAHDVQAQLYATWAMWNTGFRRVHLAWIYFQTQGPRKTRRTFITVDSGHVAEQFKAIDKTGCEIMNVRRSSPSFGDEAAKEFALTLPPNTEMCSAYGGCPYQHVCNLSPSEFVSSLIPLKKKEEAMANSTIDLFANLKKKKQTVTSAALAADTNVMGMSDRDVPAPPENKIPEPFAGVNPPEKDLPLAAPAGSVEAKPEKPKRGRPKKEEATAVEAAKVEKSGAQANSNPPNKVEKIAETVFREAWEDLGAAVKTFLKATGAM